MSYFQPSSQSSENGNMSRREQRFDLIQWYQGLCSPGQPVLLICKVTCRLAGLRLDLEACAWNLYVRILYYFDTMIFNSRSPSDYDSNYGYKLSYSIIFEVNSCDSKVRPGSHVHRGHVQVGFIFVITVDQQWRPSVLQAYNL